MSTRLTAAELRRFRAFFNAALDHEEQGTPGDTARAFQQQFWTELRARLGANSMSSGLQFLDQLAEDIMNGQTDASLQGTVVALPAPVDSAPSSGSATASTTSSSKQSKSPTKKTPKSPKATRDGRPYNGPIAEDLATLKQKDKERYDATLENALDPSNIDTYGYPSMRSLFESTEALNPDADEKSRLSLAALARIRRDTMSSTKPNVNWAGEKNEEPWQTLVNNHAVKLAQDDIMAQITAGTYEVPTVRPPSGTERRRDEWSEFEDEGEDEEKEAAADGEDASGNDDEESEADDDEDEQEEEEFVEHEDGDEESDKDEEEDDQKKAAK
ncbi:hypothetical protein PInf_024613 [Phytophthora infestans]|nr:hypothetical protein PInf_024613 [Phytophthora infestans]